MMPMDTINDMKGKEVRILLRTGETVEGVLNSFDLQQNVGLKIKGENTFIQGGMVRSVELK